MYALKPSVDNDINIGKVEEIDTHKKGFLERVFGKKDKDKKDSDKKSNGKADEQKETKKKSK